MDYLTDFNSFTTTLQLTVYNHSYTSLILLDWDNPLHVRHLKVKRFYQTVIDDFEFEYV